MKMVAIPESRFIELIETEKSAEHCRECGALAQRDSRIAALGKEKDDLVRENHAMHHRIEHDLSGGNHELKSKYDFAYRKYEAAAACIGSIESILRSGASDATEGALARIVQYHEDLDRIEKEVGQ